MTPIEKKKKDVGQLSFINNITIAIAFLSALIFCILTLYPMRMNLDLCAKICSGIIGTCIATSRYLVYRLGSVLSRNGVLSSRHWEPFAQEIRPRLNVYNLFIFIMALLALVPVALIW